MFRHLSARPSRLLTLAASGAVAAACCAPVPAAFAATAEASTAAETAAETAAVSAREAGCEIHNAVLDWGLKESFRSYISGGIAKGKWDVSDGAEYETPEFHWRNGEGSYDPATQSGSIRFTGTVVFTGHGGILHMEMKNPEVRMDRGKVTLHVDMKSNDEDGNEKVNETGVALADVKPEAIAQPGQSNPHVFFSKASATLSAAGVPAFGDFYETGEQLDPVTLSAPIDASACAAAKDQKPQSDATAKPKKKVETDEKSSSGVSPLLWVPAVAAAVGAAILGVYLVNRRRVAAAENPERSEQGTDETV